MSKVQSVVFDKDLFSIGEARNWLKENDFIHDQKVDEKENTIRFRQLSPVLFKYYRTKKITPGIQLVLGFNHQR